MSEVLLKQKDYEELSQSIFDLNLKIMEKDKEIERLKERENILQEKFSDWKKRIEKEKKYYLCERTDCCGRIKDGKKYSSLYQENERLNNIINDIDTYIHLWKLDDIGEKTMLILNDILLIKNGMSNEVIRLKGVDKE